MLPLSNHSGTSPDGGPRHLEFYKNDIFGPNKSHMANVYLHTKFYTNNFIDHRDMAQKYKSKMAAAAILNFIKSGIYWAIVMTNISLCTPNLMQICSFVTEIWPKNSNSRWRLFLPKVIFRNWLPLYHQYLSAHQI